MAKFQCTECSNLWEVTETLTMRYDTKAERIRNFLPNGQKADECKCGGIADQVKETTGWGAGLSFIDSGTGKRVSK